MVCLGIGPLAWVLLADLALPKVLHLLFDLNDKKTDFYKLQTLMLITNKFSDILYNFCFFTIFPFHLCQFFETGTSDRTNIGCNQLLKFLGFSYSTPFSYLIGLQDRIRVSYVIDYSLTRNYVQLHVMIFISCNFAGLRVIWRNFYNIISLNFVMITCNRRNYNYT